MIPGMSTQPVSGARLLFFLSLLLAPVLSAQRVLTPEGLWQLKRVGAPVVSPDGSRMLFTVSQTDVAANGGRTEVWLLDLADGGAPVAVATGSQPQWNQDGSRFAYKTRDGITIQSSDDLAGERPRFTVEGTSSAQNVLWSPDGLSFAYTKQVKLDETAADRHQDLPEANARIYGDLFVRHWDQWKDGTYSHLFVDGKDLFGDERVDTPLVPFGGAEQICWSPDSSRICYTAKRVAAPEKSTDSDLYLCAIDGSGEHVCLTEELPGFDQDPVWSPDGRYIAFSSMARDGYESDRVRLMVHDVEAATNRELLADFDANAHDVTWSPDSTRLYFTVETQGTTQVYTCALAGEAPRPVTSGRHRLGALCMAPSGRTLYAQRTTTERPAEIVAIEVDSGEIAPITDVNGGFYQGLQLPTVEAEWFDATDGKKIHSWVVKPPGFDPAKKYPLILYCQGGPQSMVGQWFSFRWNFHLMASQGYVVAAVNRRGLPGFGQEWNEQISRDWGGQAMRDLLSVCDAMQQRDYVDAARTAAVGASFGGYTVYWLMGNGGDRFACMISHCGVFNLDSMYLATEEQWFVDWDLGGPPWKSAEVAKDYQRFSPHRYVENWKTPLLVIHGERDYRVPYDQGLQAFTAAQMMGVESRFLVFPDEGHWVLQPQNGVLWQREFFGWLDAHCKP